MVILLRSTVLSNISKREKMSYHLFYNLIIFIFIAIQPISAKISENQKAFYAITSLRYGLDLVLAQNNDIFTEEDIAALWDTALKNENLCAHGQFSSLALAKSFYDDGLEIGPSETQEFMLLQAQEYLKKAWENLNPYLKNAQEVISKGKPKHSDFLLPEISPLWNALNSIFSNSGVLDTPDTLTEAGFIPVSVRPSGMVVAKHAYLPGYLVKVYIKSKKIQPNWVWAIHRCWGASNIRELIEEKKLRYFVVPDKWIYPMTSLTSSYEKLGKDLTHLSSPIALVVTDMQLVGKEGSRAAWKTRATYRHIQELYCILSHGYSSCALPANIPYTKFGKFACIDTEHPQRTHPFHHVERHLNKNMGGYFNHLLRTGGRDMPF